MKKSRFTESQIVSILKQADAGDSGEGHLSAGPWPARDCSPSGGRCRQKPDRPSSQRFAPIYRADCAGCQTRRASPLLPVGRLEQPHRFALELCHESLTLLHPTHLLARVVPAFLWCPRNQGGSGQLRNTTKQRRLQS